MDHIAINHYKIAGYELMYRAGVASFTLLRESWSTAQRIAIFCGAGNNAGDGYIVARLAIEAGVAVQVIALKSPGQLKGDAATAYLAFQQVGGIVTEFNANLHISADVVVDALLGTGLDRKVQGDFAAAIKVINEAKLPVLALDIPSGLNADTGVAMGCAVRADKTMTFIALKQGLFTAEAPEYCGSIEFNALQVPDALLQQFPVAATLLSSCTLGKRTRTSHKGHFGHVLVIGGDYGYSGAARLAAEAAARTGAGLVSIATRQQHAALMNINCPELMSHAVEQKEQLHPLLEKATVVILGPGLGQSVWAEEIVATVCAINKPLVLDADGLNILAAQKNQNPNWVLTPHPGEAARLLACTTIHIQRNRYEAAQAIQVEYGGVCVLKGAGTVIFDGEHLFVSNKGNPGMATGGMGDTLTGVIAGLCAQGLELNKAACIGVELHAQAADLAAQQGERGMLASDLLPYIRKLVNRE